MSPKQGDLIRWATDWGIYAVSETGEVHRQYPQYSYGIIMEVSHKDPDAIVVYCYDGDEGGWTLLHLIHDEFELVSEG